MNNFNEFMYPNFNFQNDMNGMYMLDEFMNMNQGNINTNMNNNNIKDDSKLYNSYEGYINGNMFKELYDTYKNYQPRRLSGKNERESKLLEINEVGFAMHDLNLYLDNFPNDREMLKKFNMYREEYNNLVNSYESKYGPLNVIGMNDSNRFNWVSSFPWEVDNNV